MRLPRKATTPPKTFHFLIHKQICLRSFFPFVPLCEFLSSATIDRVSHSLPFLFFLAYCYIQFLFCFVQFFPSLSRNGTTIYQNPQFQETTVTNRETLNSSKILLPTLHLSREGNFCAPGWRGLVPRGSVSLSRVNRRMPTHV